MLRFFGQIRTWGNRGLRKITSPGAMTGTALAALCGVVLIFPTFISAVGAAEVPLRVGFTSMTGNRLPKYLRTNDEALLELNYRTYLLGVIPKLPVFPEVSCQCCLKYQCPGTRVRSRNATQRC